MYATVRPVRALRGPEAAPATAESARRRLALVAVATLLLTVAACGEASGSLPPSEATPTAIAIRQVQPTPGVTVLAGPLLTGGEARQLVRGYLEGKTYLERVPDVPLLVPLERPCSVLLHRPASWRQAFHEESLQWLVRLDLEEPFHGVSAYSWAVEERAIAVVAHQAPC